MQRGSGGACALARPGRLRAREGGDLPLGSRTTAPSNLSGSRACAVLTAFPLCRRPEPGSERLADKGAREWSCFPDWAPAEGGASRPPPDSALGSTLVRKTLQSRVGQTSGPGGPGPPPRTIAALPLPHGLSPRPKLPDSGFLRSPAQTFPLPRRRARAPARRFRPRPRPVGVVRPSLSGGVGLLGADRLCPRCSRPAGTRGCAVLLRRPWPRGVGRGVLSRPPPGDPAPRRLPASPRRSACPGACGVRVRAL